MPTSLPRSRSSTVAGTVGGTVTSTVTSTVTDGRWRTVARWVLGGLLLAAGAAHLSTQRTEFLAQVPAWFPVEPDAVVVVSGLMELALGAALIVLRRWRVAIGLVVAGFFVAIFPGNVAQWREGIDAFGLDTGTKRFVRLFFQPVLVGWALWATGAWAWLRARIGGARRQSTSRG